MHRNNHNDTDEDLMLAFQDGDAYAFETLFERHKNGLMRFLYQMCKNWALCEDISQAVWEKLIGLAGRGKYQPDARGKFRTYLYTIAHRRFIDHTRGAHQRYQQDDPDQVIVNNTTQESPVFDPETTVDDRQRWENYMTASSGLPAEQREVLALRFELDMSWEDIAEATGVTWETARSRARYAVRKLRDVLELD